jgi:hypothetical protein
MGQASFSLSYIAQFPQSFLGVLMEHLVMRARQTCWNAEIFRVANFVELGPEPEWRNGTYKFTGQYRPGGQCVAPIAAPKPLYSPRPWTRSEPPGQRLGTRVVMGGHRTAPEWSFKFQVLYRLEMTRRLRNQNTAPFYRPLEVRQIGTRPYNMQRPGVDVISALGSVLTMEVNANDAAEQMFGANAQAIGQVLQPMFDALCRDLMQRLGQATLSPFAEEILRKALERSVLDVSYPLTDSMERRIQNAAGYDTRTFQAFRAFGDNPDAYVRQELTRRGLALPA